MLTYLDPKTFGLPAATRIVRLAENHFAIVIDRKSRIVMKDGEKIREKADRIRTKHAGARVDLLTSAPVCSKTSRYLSEHHITVENRSTF